MSRLAAAALLIFLLSASAACAQDAKGSPNFSRRNSFGVFGEYSNDSSHIFLGQAEQRRLVNAGITYSRRLVASRAVDLQYLFELRPVILESDPLAHRFVSGVISFPGQMPITFTEPENTYATVQKCQPSLLTTTGPFEGSSDQQGTITTTFRQTCGGRKWTFGEGMSPAGIKMNFRPRHRLQPVFTGLGGYMFATEPIPVAQAGSFNFTFEFGAGLEWFASRDRSQSIFGNRSVRVEYRYHHLSNHFTAQENPGIDSGMLQVTYAFGR